MEEAMEVVEMVTNNTGDQNLLIILLIVLVAVVFVGELIQKFKGLFGLQTKWDIREKYEIESIKALQNEVKEFENDQNDIKQALEALKEAIHTLTLNFDTMKEKQDSISRARIKDRISQSYKYYQDRDKDKDIIQWTTIEKESLLDLIDSYEKAGGNNSFIHTLVLPEIQRWEVID